jgi:hypothetical protein
MWDKDCCTLPVTVVAFPSFFSLISKPRPVAQKRHFISMHSSLVNSSKESCIGDKNIRAPLQDNPNFQPTP